LAKKCSEVLENPQRPPKLSMLSNDKKREVMPALSNLSKFLEFMNVGRLSLTTEV
jgi:hypothetical protein